MNRCKMTDTMQKIGDTQNASEAVREKDGANQASLDFKLMGRPWEFETQELSLGMYNLK